ncbi:hypothetical protein EYF80_001656 [Liparis tanakae]|uniref:Uncharacterized protein n=1 Tax=Liparis tanakae TaxID=230148 RepID=A0A4Z2JCQ2_9TELE|nr:hypothetical protein EYF80_001656 [Liparis tanakae]
MEHKNMIPRLSVCLSVITEQQHGGQSDCTWVPEGKLANRLSGPCFKRRKPEEFRAWFWQSDQQANPPCGEESRVKGEVGQPSSHQSWQRLTIPAAVAWSEEKDSLFQGTREALRTHVAAFQSRFGPVPGVPSPVLVPKVPVPGVLSLALVPSVLPGPGSPHPVSIPAGSSSPCSISVPVPVPGRLPVQSRFPVTRPVQPLFSLSHRLVPASLATRQTCRRLRLVPVGQPTTGMKYHQTTKTRTKQYEATLGMRRTGFTYTGRRRGLDNGERDTGGDYEGGASNHTGGNNQDQGRQSQGDRPHKDFKTRHKLRQKLQILTEI